jgi:hypothetical protein
MGSLAAINEPPTEIDNDERRGDGENEAADDYYAH